MLTVAHLDAPLILYALALSFLCALVFGFAPAAQLLRTEQVSALSRSRRYRFQSVFVVAEVAAALVLLLSTTLLLRSFWNASQIDPGFQPAHVTTAYLLKPKNDPTFLDRTDAELRSLTNGASALAYPLPFAGGGLTSSFLILGRTRQAGEPEWHGEAYLVSPTYFSVLQIPLLRGRLLSAADSATAPRVCLVDAKLADQYFAGQDPLGQRLGMYGGPATIVGVVRTIRATTLESGSRPVVYYPLAQVPLFPSTGILVRSPQNAAPLIRSAIARTNRSVAVFDIQTIPQRIGESLGLRRVAALLVLVFAGVCLLLATVGLHGVIAQVVSERSGEIAIRLALGGEPGQILRSFLVNGLACAALGLALGLAAFTVLQRWIAHLLYGVTPFDPAAFAFSCVLILVILTAAVWLPSRRASRVQPHQLLRYE